MAPFERPVVPEVYRMTARSSGPRSATGQSHAATRAADINVPSEASPRVYSVALCCAQIGAICSAAVIEETTTVGSASPIKYSISVGV